MFLPNKIQYFRDVYFYYLIVLWFHHECNFSSPLSNDDTSSHASVHVLVYFVVLRRRLPRMTLSIKLPCEGLGQSSEEPCSMEDKFSFNITFSCSFEELPFTCTWSSSIQYYVFCMQWGKSIWKESVGKKERKNVTHGLIWWNAALKSTERGDMISEQISQLQQSNYNKGSHHQEEPQGVSLPY